jgi:short subunit dehydrogenase-like uncharacterized protein
MMLLVLTRALGNQFAYGANWSAIVLAALCLALDNLPSSGGCMTPASAMGVPLIKRLNANNLLFEVEGVKAEM